MPRLQKKQIAVTVLVLLAVPTVLILLRAGSGNEDRRAGLEEALSAYQNGDLAISRRIAAAHLPKAAARLVFSLCQVYHTERQDLPGGLTGLKEIFEDVTIAPSIRAEAALNYAGVIQIFQARGMHKEYANVDIGAVYQKVIQLAAMDIKACTAAIYLGQWYLDKQDAGQDEKAFHFIEGFLENYPGPPENTVPVHLFIEVFYIDRRSDYASSVGHLKDAYDLGIAKDTVRREVLFRMGRIYDAKLKQVNNARMVYQQFLELYPSAAQTPVVRRYLKELG